jgi:alpha-N-arabinofuranosidase
MLLVPGGALAVEEAAMPSGTEFHVSVKGDDANDGSALSPLRTISAAAQLARPGDVITVHEGIYRERITPPRGGESPERRIVYRAAPGERAEIRGSEVVTGWEAAGEGVWKVSIPNTLFGDYNPFAVSIRGDWFNPLGRPHHTGAVYLNGTWLMEAATLDAVLRPAEPAPLWFAEAGETSTTVWARFGEADPNKELVEVNVRPVVFYPEKPGMNYITVRGFVMRHAATQWAPPTAEQPGLLGTHWSRGWVIEDNVISHSKCTGITLGKYGDEWDNTSEDTAEGYVLTIERALDNGWSRENIGGHLVRNNRISHCEQAGLVGSLGAVFSRITGNTIHDIHVERLFTGAEMAGIKIHAAIDTEISGNRIFRTVLGIWLDWMAQGTRVTGNLLHDNINQDLFVEVNHGPFLVDNNLFLSDWALFDMSQGGAYVHNLMAGRVVWRPELGRATPYHKAHTTEVAGLIHIEGGDNRFFNNVFVGHNGLAEYEKAPRPLFADGNVYLLGAKPYRQEENALVSRRFDPGLRLSEEAGTLYLHMTADPAWRGEQARKLVTTEMLGAAAVPALPYVNPDQSSVRIDTDYTGAPRDTENPFPGPFEAAVAAEDAVRVWPKTSAAQ